MTLEGVDMMLRCFTAPFYMSKAKCLATFTVLRLQSSTTVHGSISLIAEPRRSVQIQSMLLVMEAGALLSYGPNPKEALWPSPENARTNFWSSWDQAHIAYVSVKLCLSS
jgi:hypothetical protein